MRLAVAKLRECTEGRLPAKLSQILRLSDRSSLLKPSPTLGITAKANAMKAEGKDVVSFGAGEPDFDTPEPIREAAIAAINGGFSKYTPSSGIKDLKEAIAGKLLRENGLRYSPDQIVVSVGAKHAIFNTMQLLLNPGDEVILIAPYWMTYADQVRLAGGVPVVVHTRGEDDFVPSSEAIREAISEKTRAIVLNSPSNPTGAMLPRQFMKEVAALAIRHDFWIIADEIYERLIYGDAQHTSIASLGEEVYNRTITVNGVSKTYAMTGWRIGFSASPLPVAKLMGNLQDQMTSNPASIAQKAAVAAYHLPTEAVEAMRQEFSERRDLIVGLLRSIPNVKVSDPKGAFYAFPDFSHYLGEKLASDADLATYLLETANVATVPGSVFEGAGHLRLSYAASRKDIQRGVERIAEALGGRNA